MGRRTVTYITCDSCFRVAGIGNDVEIVKTQTVTTLFGGSRTIDICADCDEAGKYYCRLCERIHTDGNPCDAHLREIELAEACAKEMGR
jgi:hypothetical protein